MTNQKLDIDEASRRWPDFQGGRPIDLPVGGIWWFYEPGVTRRVTATAAGGFETSLTWSFGADVSPAVEHTLSARFDGMLQRWARARTDEDRAAALLSCAWFLLARNYAIGPEEFGAILEGADAARQEALGASLLALIGDACSHSNALRGAA